MSPRFTGDPLLPMLASIGREMPGAGWIYEPKYDGIRVLAGVAPEAIRLMTRNQNDKAAQFPEIVQALSSIVTRLGYNLILDGEIVSIRDGKPARFQQLQARMHLEDREEIDAARKATPAILIAFDILLEGTANLLDEPWHVRRMKLERLLNRQGNTMRNVVQLSELLAYDDARHGAHLLDEARTHGWEGVIAKDPNAPYQPGVRTTAWQKLKVEFRQEFVVGGFTAPRNTREYLGALLVGYYHHGEFVYAGHVGGGFDRAALKMIYGRLRSLVQPRSPFKEQPRANERPQWVRPEVVIEVKFSQWTDDGRLRQPIFVGVRDDIVPGQVKREARSVQKTEKSANHTSMTPSSSPQKPTPPKRVASAPAREPVRREGLSEKTIASVLTQIDTIERAGEGILRVGRAQLEVTNADKVFFPKDGYTKSDLMRYYTRVAPLLLPAIAKRPLVLRRFPEGITGDAFYQHKAGDVPPGVKTATVEIGGGKREQIIGGDLLTLLYTIQLGSISVDPWHTHVPHIEYADYAILDLDPGPKASFQAVVTVAQWVKETLDAFGFHGALKTSGATGLHIYLPLPRRTSNESAQIFAELIATHVASEHPAEATVERTVRERKPTAVYVDYLQNILGKTVAGPYSVRARPGAPVSTPLRWDELTDDLDPMTFTIGTVLSRFTATGDIWEEAMRTPNTLPVAKT